jgi:hypothetical protein
VPVPSRYFLFGLSIGRYPLQDAAMKKLIKIISVIMALFILASLCLYRIQFHRAKGQNQGRTEPVTPFETKLAQGQISEIDNDTKTILVMNDNQLISFSYDDKTAISAAGHFVQPMAITSGTRVTVRYWSKGNKNWAKEILLMPAPSTLNGDNNGQ